MTTSSTNSRGVNRSKNPGGPGSKKSGGATYKAEKGGCVIYYISVKKLGGPWLPRPPQCLRPCNNQFTNLLRIMNLDPRCSLSFFMAASISSLLSKLAIASPDGRPSLFKITLTETHFASGRKKSLISFSDALKGNPDIFMQFSSCLQ